MNINKKYKLACDELERRNEVNEQDSLKGLSDSDLLKVIKTLRSQIDKQGQQWR